MINDILRNIQRNGLDLVVNPAATELGLQGVEQKLAMQLPDQVREFYLNCNGLEIKSPAFRIFPVEEWERIGGNLIFARFDNQYDVALKVDQLNCAGQWDIVNHDRGFVITHTMASFVANKMLAWVNRGRCVWCEEVYE